MFRFSKKNILLYANKYDASYREKYDAKIESRLKGKLAHQDHLTHSDFMAIGRWKSKRPTKHYEANDEKLVRAATKVAFTTKNEELRIKVLMVLNGCNYPLASTILHFKYPNRYPIIDFRVLWSVREMRRPITYSFDLWKQYVKEIQSLSVQYKVNIRTLDKALWKYSEEKQKKESNAGEKPHMHSVAEPMPRTGDVFVGKINDLFNRDAKNWKRRDISFYKHEIRRSVKYRYPSQHDKIILIDIDGNKYELNFSKPESDDKVCLGTPSRLKPWYQKKGFGDQAVNSKDRIYFEYTGQGIEFIIRTEDEYRLNR